MKVNVSFPLDTKDLADLMANLPPIINVTVDPLPVDLGAVKSKLPSSVMVASEPPPGLGLVLVKYTAPTEPPQNSPTKPGRGLRIVKPKVESDADTDQS